MADPWTNPLSAEWCGSDAEHNDTQHAVFSATAPQYKVLYLHPAGQLSRLDQQGPEIQGSLYQLQQSLASATGYTKGLRLDLGTACSPGALDIQAIPLPQSPDYYNSNADRRMDRLVDSVRKQTRDFPEHWNLLLFVDGLPWLDGIAGEADWYNDDQPLPQRQSSSQGGMVATIYHLGEGLGYGGPGVVMHEVAHTLGAVQNSAPNSSRHGHCTDEEDLMCYVDAPGVQLSWACGLEDGAWGSMGLLDCGRDDYFSPRPTPGSYLDRHWNIYDSVFLCELSSCGQPDTQAPPAPTGLRLQHLWRNYVQLSWARPPSAAGVSSYRILDGKRKLPGSPRLVRGRLTLQLRLPRRRVVSLQVRAIDASGNLSAPARARRLRIG